METESPARIPETIIDCDRARWPAGADLPCS